MAHDDPELLAQMAMVQAGGTGWINIEPVIDEEHRAARTRAVRLPRRLDPPGARRHLDARQAPGRTAPTRPTTVGLQHALGPRGGVASCATSACPCPRGGGSPRTIPGGAWWPRCPADADNRPSSTGCCEAAAAVCQVPTTGRWEAAVHAGLA